MIGTEKQIQFAKVLLESLEQQAIEIRTEMIKVVCSYRDNPRKYEGFKKCEKEVEKVLIKVKMHLESYTKASDIINFCKGRIYTNGKLDLKDNLIRLAEINPGEDKIEVKDVLVAKMVQKLRN